MGAGQVKVPQARYTYLLPGGMSVSGSLESNQTGGIIATAGTGASPVAVAPGAFDTFNDFNAPGISQKFPAATSTFQIQQPWGHAGFHVVLAQARITNLGSTLGPAFATGVTQGDHISRWGYQLSQTGHLNTIGKDKITWQLQYGQGASNYTWSTNELGLQWEEDLVCSHTATTLNCSQPRDLGANVGYSHWWTNEWRSGVAFGYDQVSRPNAAGDWGQAGLSSGAGNALATLERKHYSADVNLMWTPVAGVQFGVEYEWYHRTVWSGAHGSSNRLEGQALFAF
jgi:hypothetical protein